MLCHTVAVRALHQRTVRIRAIGSHIVKVVEDGQCASGSQLVDRAVSERAPVIRGPVKISVHAEY